MVDSLAVVTGGGSGIGWATVQALVRQGWAVAALGRRQSRLHGWSKGELVTSLECDVTDRDQVRDTFARIYRDLGPISGLVNCAGVLSGGMLDSLSPESADKQWSTNVLGTVWACQAVLSYVSTSGCSIVNIGSLLTQRCTVGSSIYTATKAAVEGLSKSLALELAPRGIRVNVVSPSLVDSHIYLASGMSEQDYRKKLEDWGSEFPLGRVGNPFDVAGLIAFLLNRDLAPWITGSVIRVDGGRGVA